jgi:hypothetical protein
VVTIGLALILLRKTTELVNFRYGDVELTLPVGFSLAIVGIAITLFPSLNSSVSTTPAPPGNLGPNIPIPTAQNPTLFPIKIDPVNNPVPCRATFTGAGDVPSDRRLWLIIQRVGSPSKYYPKPAFVTAADRKWTAANVTVGSKDTLAGSLYMIYAVLVDDEIDQFLKHRHAKEELESIPGRQVDQIQISRSGDVNDC